MTLEERKILALTECLILWDYLAETGIANKYTAIRHLYRSGKLSQTEYVCNCPFCCYLRNFNAPQECAKCLWPRKNIISNTRCIRLKDSPFRIWRYSATKAELKSNANAILDMLLSIEI